MRGGMVTVQEIRNAGFDIPSDIVRIFRDVNKTDKTELSDQFIVESAAAIRAVAGGFDQDKLVKQLVDLNILTMRMIVQQGGDLNELLQKGVAKVGRGI